MKRLRPILLREVRTPLVLCQKSSMSLPRHPGLHGTHDGLQQVPNPFHSIDGHRREAMERVLMEKSHEKCPGLYRTKGQLFFSVIVRWGLWERGCNLLRLSAVFAAREPREQLRRATAWVRAPVPGDKPAEYLEYANRKTVHRVATVKHEACSVLYPIVREVFDGPEFVIHILAFLSMHGPPEYIVKVVHEGFVQQEGTTRLVDSAPMLEVPGDGRGLPPATAQSTGLADLRLLRGVVPVPVRVVCPSASKGHVVREIHPHYFVAAAKPTYDSPRPRALEGF